MTTSRSIPVNAVLMKQLRTQRGWTQAELARRSGYSVRLIRKAEAGNKLDLESINALAQTLSQAEGIVAPKQLMLDHKAIVEKFLRALDNYGGEMALHVRDYIADDFVLICPGDPKTAPFIGTWYGPDGLHQFFSIYCSIFRRLPAAEVTFAVADDAVIMRYLESGYMGDQLCGPVRVNMHFKFRDGLIVRLDDDYDTQGAAEIKRKAEENLAKRSSSA